MAYTCLTVLCTLITLCSGALHHPPGSELIREEINKTNASRRLTVGGAYPHLPLVTGKCSGKERIITVQFKRDVGNSRTQRIVNQARSSVTIIVNTQTSLYVQAGQSATLYFDITNNNNWNVFIYFYCSTLTSTVQLIQPSERWIAGLDTLTVKVVLSIGNLATTTEAITFTAVTYSTSGDDPTFIKAYLYIGQQVSDYSNPDVSYTLNGDCSSANTPSTCSGTTWGLQANIQDKQSGLLSVATVPSGFVFTSDFIAGTRDQVSGRYSNSCCFNKVDLIATDLNGNQYKTSIDINNVWLSAAAIAAIVLACILLLLLLVLLCCAIGFCIRRRRKTSTFTMHT